MFLGSLQAAVSGMLFGHPDDTPEQRNLRYIILSGAFVGFIDGGIGVYLPVYLARLGASPTVMGLLAAGPQLINMLLYLPGGALVERQRNLVRLVNINVSVARCGYLVIAVLPFLLLDQQIPLAVALTWSAISATTALFWPALLVVIQRSVSPKLRPRATGGRWAAMTVVAAILIPILGYVLDHTPFPVGYQLVFVVSFVGALPNIFFFSRIRIPPNVHRERANDHLPATQRMREYLGQFAQNKLFVRFNMATAAFRICLSMPAGLYSLYWVQQLQATDTWIGVRGLVGFAVLAVGYWGWGRLAHRMGHRLLLLITGATMGLYPIVTGLAQSVEWLLPAAMIWGMSVAGIDIGLVDMLLLSSPEQRKPSFVAIGNMLASAENFIGPLLGAALAPLIGIQNALLLSGGLVIVSVFFFLLLPSRTQEYAIHATQEHPAS